ncbi:ankyrin repeat and SOCS box protein 8-like [Lineus longissimus]|uniref:ankyrin repeat and SOCS box protein 8-like n=1 Tax=Lineus longissimus TaxID=88925 RepID=UPI002B4F32A9
MYYIMSKAQAKYHLSERLIRAISNWQVVAGVDDDVEELLEAGAEVNQSHGTLLPLHCACMVSDVYCLRLLIEKGADVNMLDGYGRCALHYAAEKDATCCEILLSHGADVNTGDGNQGTALHWAAFKNNIECVKVLLQHGAHVNILDFNMNNPLSWAAQRGNLQSLKILLEYNADVDVRNYNQQTPLMRCAMIQNTGLNTDQDDASLELLIKASGDLKLRNGEGELPGFLTRNNKLCELLMPYCQQPRRLSDLSRYVIRKSMGSVYLPNAVKQLPLPSMLQDFLLLAR